MDRWVEHMQGMINNRNYGWSHEEQQRRMRKSIYQVPSHIKQVNERAYQPQVVSFGPYHHREAHLAWTEAYKERVLCRCIDRSGRCLQEVIDFVADVAQQLKDSYDSLIYEWQYSIENFVKLMILDGCFMLEVLYAYKYVNYYPEDDPIFGSHGVFNLMHLIKVDMLMLENQLPMSLLLKLKCILENVEPDIAALNEDILLFLGHYVSYYPEGEYLHVLDLFHESLLSKDNKNGNTAPLVSRSSTHTCLRVSRPRSQERDPRSATPSTSGFLSPRLSKDDKNGNAAPLVSRSRSHTCLSVSRPRSQERDPRSPTPSTSGSPSPRLSKDNKNGNTASLVSRSRSHTCLSVSRPRSQERDPQSPTPSTSGSPSPRLLDQAAPPPRLPPYYEGRASGSNYKGKAGGPDNEGRCGGPYYAFGPYHERERKNGHKVVRPAAELHEAGVRFENNGSKCLRDITFDNGLLKLPNFMVYDDTESIFLNLIAFERCHPPASSDITSFVEFMDHIIDDGQDIKLLSSKGIISNYIGTDKEAADLINTMAKGLGFATNSNLFEVYKKLIDYSNLRWNKWRANLIHTYFRNPWSIISVMAAAFLLSLTIVQTVFTILN